MTLSEWLARRRRISRLQSDIRILDHAIEKAEAAYPQHLKYALQMENPFLVEFIHGGIANVQVMKDFRNILRSSIQRLRQE